MRRARALLVRGRGHFGRRPQGHFARHQSQKGDYTVAQAQKAGIITQIQRYDGLRAVSYWFLCEFGTGS